MAGEKYQDALVAHIEYQVENALVVYKSPFLLKHLVIGCGDKSRIEVSPLFFGMDNLAKIVFVVFKLDFEIVGISDMVGLDTNPGTHEFAQLLVVIEQEFKSLFVERAQFVQIIFKERGGIVCRNN